MDVYYKFQDIFHPLNRDSDSERSREKILHEQMMTADFIGTLITVKDAETRNERNWILQEAKEGRHKRFAHELSKIMEMPSRADTNREINSLLVLMNEYASILAAIKTAPSHEDVVKIINNCLIY